MNEELIQLTLNRQEALVLFEWLASLEDKELNLMDDAEHKLLGRIEGQLESTLTDVIAPDYAEALLAAKKAILDSEK